MAKNKQNDGTENQTEGGAPESGAEGSTPKPTVLTIAGAHFSVLPTYSEGHVLLAVEAHALNQTRAENLRNNFSGKVKAAVATKVIEATKAKAASLGVEPSDPSAALTDEEKAAASVLTETEIAELQTALDNYAASYVFSGASRGTAAPIDPVGKETWKMAKDIVQSHIRSKNIDLKTVEDLDGMIQALIDKNPSIREEAERRIASQKALAALAA